MMRIIFFSLFLLAALSSSFASSFISDDIFASDASIGRILLQVKQACPTAFEFQNYTIITSQCRGPLYPAEQCCASFKEFACPFAEDLNDLSNDCASTMFSYINLHGRYPPGLFASECREGKNGLECPALPPSESAEDNDSGSFTPYSPSLLFILASVLVGSSLLLF